MQIKPQRDITSQLSKCRLSKRQENNKCGEDVENSMKVP